MSADKWRVAGTTASEVGMFADDHYIEVDGDDLVVHTIGVAGLDNVPAEQSIPIEIVLAVLRNAGKLSAT